MRDTFFARIAVRLAVVAIASAATATTCSAAHSTTPSQRDVQAAINKAYARYVEATKSKNAAAAASLYDDEAMLLPPHEKPVSGKDAILAYYRKFYASPGRLLAETFTTLDLHVSTDLALEVVDENGAVDVPDHGTISFHGKSFVVWKRQTDGSWKIYRDMWDEYPPGQ